MTDDPKPVVAQKSNRTTVITIVSISGIFVLFVAALWGAGFLTFSGSDPSSKVVAAALALLGGLVAAIVSIIGIVLKYSIDQRTETRLQIEATRAAADRKAESDRASALQTQAEQRLGLEAAIRAVELLGANAEGGALQRAGALFALSNLNQHELTLDLTSYLLNNGDLEPSMACTLIDRALMRGDEGIKRRAIMVLEDNAKRMVTSLDTHVPASIINWDDCLSSTYVQEWSLSAVLKILLARPLSEWQTEFPTHASGLFGTFALAWSSELDPRVKADCGVILNILLRAFPNWRVIHHPKMSISLDRLALETEALAPETSEQEEIATTLNSWLDAPPSSPP